MDAQIIMEQTKKAPKRRATEQAVIATPAKTPDGGMTARQMGDRSLLGSEAWENIDRTVNATMARFTAGSLC